MVKKWPCRKWILGLRQLFRLEAVKVAPKTWAEAEFLVAYMEDAYKGKVDSDRQNKRTKRGKSARNTSRKLRRQS